MSANVETLFVVREPAWHKQGILLDNPPTSEDAIVAAGLDWTVSQQEISVEGRKIPGYLANVRSSDNSVLGIVTKKYSIVQNAEAFAFTDGLLGEGLVYESAGSLRGGKQVWMLGKMPERKILDEDFEPYVCFTNTHDGEGAVRVCCTPTRVVCQNTLNLALAQAKRSWSTRHVGNMEGKLQEARMTLGLMEEYYAALEEEADRLANLKISDEAVEAMIDALYPIEEDASDIRKKRSEDLKRSFFTCLRADDIKKYKGTAYAVINAAADFADHAEPMRMTQKYEENRWGQVITGHPFVDNIYKQILKAA